MMMATATPQINDMIGQPRKIIALQM